MMMLICSNINSLLAQTSVCQGLSASTVSSHNVIFHVENTNPYPISINKVSARISDWGGPGSREFKLMYNPTPLYAVGGMYGSVGTGVSGWLDAGPIVTITIPSMPGLAPVDIFTGIDLVIPPGDTYTLCIATTLNSVAVYNVYSPVETMVDGVKIKTGPDIGWVGYEDIFYDSGIPAFYPWGFIGCIEFGGVVDCEGTPDAGTLTSTSVCPSTAFSISPTGSGSYTGMTRIWQSRPVGSPTWTTIAGATTSSLSIPGGITTPTEYRTITNCSFSGLSDTSNIATVNINPYYDCYCIPSASYATINYITDVTTTLGVTNFSNPTSTGSGTSPGYTNFYTTHSVSAVQGTSFDISVTEFGSLGQCKIWIDWNQDGVFDEFTEEVYANTELPGLYTFTGSISVPLTAIPGETRMRVRTNWIYGTPLDPCSNMDYGEAEDYKMIVIEAIPCDDPSILLPSTVTSVATPNMVCGSGSSTLSISTVMPIASGYTYKWQKSSTTAGPWVDISTPDIVDEFSYTDISADTYFRCLIYCNGTLIKTSELTFVESVIPVLPTLFEGQHCGPGPVELTATIGSGNVFWYENPTGGAPIGTGTSFLTPELTETTVFYASGGASPGIDTFVGTSPGSTYTSTSSPFYYGWGGYKHQYLIRASELEAIGLVNGSLINSIGFNVVGYTGTTFNDFSVAVGTTSAANLSSGYITGLTEIVPPAGYMPTTGINYFDMSTPLVWDGVSNIVIQTCFNNGDWGGTSVAVEYSSIPFVGHRYTYADYSTYAAICGSSSGSTVTTSERPLVFFNVSGCETERLPITAHIRDVPFISILESDGTYCLFNNEMTLHSNPALPPAHTLLWSTGATSQDIIVGPSAPDTKYWVEITNEFGCTASDTVTLTLNPSPTVDLGPDRLICEGGTLTLDAGPDGTSYFWNTGENTRTIVVENDGEYTVLVTNSFSCMATDTVRLVVDGFAPEISGIIVEHLSGNTFRFSAHLPMYVDNYEWDFGDGTATSVSPIPIHTYAEPGTYEVKLKVVSSCASVDYVTYTNVFSSLDPVLQNSFNIYPNPTNDVINIISEGSAQIENIKITNVLGQNLLDNSNFVNKKNVQIDVTRLPSGHYNIMILTDQGNVIKSFNVIK